MSKQGTYTQLRDGSWGIKVQGRAIAGDNVHVTKKSGESKDETVGSVLWSGNDNRTGNVISLCTIAQSNPKHGKVRTKYGCRDGECFCPACTSGSECLCKCSCGFGG